MDALYISPSGCTWNIHPTLATCHAGGPPTCLYRPTSGTSHPTSWGNSQTGKAMLLKLRWNTDKLYVYMYMYKFKARQCNVFFVWNKYFLFLKLEFRYCFFLAGKKKHLRLYVSIRGLKRYCWHLQSGISIFHYGSLSINLRVEWDDTGLRTLLMWPIVSI